MKFNSLFIKKNLFFLSWVLIILSINTSYNDLIKSSHTLDFTRALLGIIGLLLTLLLFIKEIYLNKLLFLY